MDEVKRSMNSVLGTILIAVILLLVIALVIFSMIRDKKAGKSVICGGSCKTCGGCCSSCKGCPRSGMADPAGRKCSN